MSATLINNYNIPNLNTRVAKFLKWSRYYNAPYYWKIEYDTKPKKNVNNVVEKSKYPLLGLNSKMPFGKFKDCLIDDIPKSYINWLYDQNIKFTKEVLDKIGIK